MPIVHSSLDCPSGFHGVSVERGVVTSIRAAPFTWRSVYFLFTSADDFVAAFMPHAAALQADIPNYTAIALVVQFSTVEIAHVR